MPETSQTRETLSLWWKSEYKLNKRVKYETWRNILNFNSIFSLNFLLNSLYSAQSSSKQTSCCVRPPPTVCYTGHVDFEQWPYYPTDITACGSLSGWTSSVPMDLICSTMVEMIPWGNESPAAALVYLLSMMWSDSSNICSGFEEICVKSFQKWLLPRESSNSYLWKTRRSECD